MESNQSFYIFLWILIKNLTNNQTPIISLSSSLGCQGGSKVILARCLCPDEMEWRSNKQDVIQSYQLTRKHRPNCQSNYEKSRNHILHPFRCWHCYTTLIRMLIIPMISTVKPNIIPTSWSFSRKASLWIKWVSSIGRQKKQNFIKFSVRNFNL